MRELFKNVYWEGELVMEKSNKVLSGGQLAGGNSANKREEHDFYATDPQTVRVFKYTFKICIRPYYKTGYMERRQTN